MTGTVQLRLLAPGEPGACDAGCDVCDAAEQLWGHRYGGAEAFATMSRCLHEADGRLGEAYARARGAWPR
ncbi:MAG: hypothetical protein F4Y14_14430 [Acidobacteria bacterium]|nr:hypothetical protein [Acidobacteriota bacterium]